MGWHEQLFRYCERGLDPSFWAEPFNAVSNLAFLAVAAVMFGRLRRLPSTVPAGHRAALHLLVALVAVVAAGSFLFHTFATRWALIADVAPIGIFMTVYLAFALRAMLGLGWTSTGSIMAAFLAATVVLSNIACPSKAAYGVLPVMGQLAVRGEPCLKGTIGYVPALLALVVTGCLIRRRHPASRDLLAAAAIFFCAMLLRWLDRDLCRVTWVFGAVRGTHALWHLLNAATIALLMSAAIKAVAPSQQAGEKPH